MLSCFQARACNHSIGHLRFNNCAMLHISHMRAALRTQLQTDSAVLNFGRARLHALRLCSNSGCIVQEMTGAFKSSDHTLNPVARHNLPLDRMQWQAGRADPLCVAVPSHDLLKFDGPRGMFYKDQCITAFEKTFQLCESSPLLSYLAVRAWSFVHLVQWPMRPELHLRVSPNSESNVQAMQGVGPLHPGRH
jgi:hypothetical protein